MPRNSVEVFRVEVGAAESEFKRVAASIDRVSRDLELSILQRELQIVETQQRMDNAKVASSKVAAQRRLNFVTAALESEKQKLQEVYQARIRLQRAEEQSLRVLQAQATIAAGAMLPATPTSFRRGRGGATFEQIAREEAERRQVSLAADIAQGQARINDIEARGADLYARFEKAKTYTAKAEAFKRMSALRAELEAQIRLLAAAQSQQAALARAFPPVVNRAALATVPPRGTVSIVRTVPPGAIEVSRRGALGQRLFGLENPFVSGPPLAARQPQPPGFPIRPTFPTPPPPPSRPLAITIPPGMQSFFAQMLGAQLAAYAIRGAILSWVQGMKDGVVEGLKLNALFELMKIGVAATLAQNVKITDAQGKQLEGLQAVLAAQGESEGAQKKIIQAAIESGAGLDNFLEAFRIALPLALQMGASVTDTVDVTKRLVLAATAIGVPFDLVRLQIDDIMRGVVTTRTTLARVLGLTQDMLRPAREQGTIIDLIKKKTDAFLVAQEEIAGTFTLMGNRMRLLGQIVLREATSGGFMVLKNLMSAILREVINVDRVTGEFTFRKDALDIIEKMKEAITSFFAVIRDQAPTMVDLLLSVLGIFGRLVAGINLAAVAIRGFTDTSDADIKRMMGMRAEAQKEIERRQKEGAGPRGGIFPSEVQQLTDVSLKNHLQAIDTEIAATYRQKESLLQSAESAYDFAFAIQGLSDSQQQLVDKVRTASLALGGQSSALLQAQRAAREVQEELNRPLPELRNFARGLATPGRALSKFTLIPVRQPEEEQVIIARAKEAIEEKILILKSAQVKVEVELARFEQAGITSSFEEFEARKSSLSIRKAQLDVAIAQASVESQLAVTSKLKGGQLGSRQAAQLARDRADLVKAQGALEIERTKGLQAVAFARADDIRLRIGEKINQIELNRIALKGQIVALEVAEGKVAPVILAERRFDLETMEASLKVMRARLELQDADARLAAARTTQNKKSILDASTAQNKAEIDVRDAIIEQNAQREKGLKAIRDAEAEESSRAGRLARARFDAESLRRMTEADRGVLDAERALADVKRATLMTDQVARQEAENRLSLAQANLEVEKSREELLARELELEMARAKLFFAMRDKGAGSADAQAALAEVQGALAARDAAKLSVERAMVGVTARVVDNYEAMTAAIRDQLSTGGKLLGLFNDLSNIAGQFGAKLPRGLTQFFAGVKGFFASLANATSGVREALKGTSNEAKGAAITGPLGAFGAVFGKGGVGLKGLFAGGLTQGLSGLLGLAGPIGAVAAVVTTLIQKIGFSWKGFLFGALAGAGVGGLIGGLIGGGKKRKQERKISKTITDEINATIKSLNDGTTGLGASIKQLEDQRAKAVATLSGSKNAKRLRDQITASIDDQLTALRARVKQVFDAFDSDLRVMRAPDALNEIAGSIENINKKIKEFLDAGGDFARANEFLALSLRKVYKDTTREITDSELETIDLLEKEIDLQKQREDIIKQAAERSRDVRQRLGLVRVQTAAQTAAQEIKKINEQRDEQLKKIDREQKLLEAELGARREIFGLQTGENALLERRLELSRLDTAELIIKIQLLQAFLRDNAAAFSAALAVPQGIGLTVPTINTAGQLVPGSVTWTIGQVNVTVTPGMTPAEAWSVFQAGLNYGMGGHIDESYYDRRGR